MSAGVFAHVCIRYISTHVFFSGHACVGAHTQVVIHLHVPECMCEYTYVPTFVSDFMSVCGSACMCIHVSTQGHTCDSI